MINPRINDDLVLIMISDRDNQANTRFQDEKMLKFKSFTQKILCLDRKQDKSQFWDNTGIYTIPKKTNGFH